jgi:hypothetical protein
MILLLTGEENRAISSFAEEGGGESRRRPPLSAPRPSCRPRAHPP